jgi:hypothetical protein
MKLFVKLFAVTLLVGLSGCAAGYHRYPCGCVPYGYRRPAPLPYASYCGCSTPIASSYAATGGVNPGVWDQADVDASAGGSSAP